MSEYSLEPEAAVVAPVAPVAKAKKTDKPEVTVPDTASEYTFVSGNVYAPA